MLSSVLQQRGDIPKIVFNVAYPKNNGNPATENVCSFFTQHGLTIRETVYADEIAIQRRGLVRNAQIDGTKCDYMLFADSDMVYSPHFFEDLGQKLAGELGNETRCISTTRVSLGKEFCIDYFRNQDNHTYPCVIENVADIVSKWPVYRISRSCGAGYFQLASVKSIQANGGLYVEPSKCADIPEHERFHKTRSDKQFRRRIGGTKHIKTLPQYHLNHVRDNEVGYHTKEQR